MEGRFPFPKGLLTCRAQGEWVLLHMERAVGEGLYRGWLRGKSGRMDLGVLLPMGEGLFLDRKLSVSALRQRGCWPITGAGAELAHAFSPAPPSPPEGWQWEDRPARLFGGDGLLRQAAEKAGRCLLRREGAGFRLAYLWDGKRPFPLPPLFCFGRVERLGGRDRLVFLFRENGQPEMPPEEAHDGDGPATL